MYFPYYLIKVEIRSKETMWDREYGLEHAMTKRVVREHRDSVKKADMRMRMLSK